MDKCLVRNEIIVSNGEDGKGVGGGDFRSERTLSCGHGLSLLASLWGLKTHAIPAGVATLRSDQLECSKNKESLYSKPINTLITKTL